MADILYTTDLQVDGGDFASISDLLQEDQHQEHILLASKGDYILYPLVGYGAEQKLNGPFDPIAERRDIRVELERDDYRVNSVTISSDYVVDIDAPRLIR